MRYLLINGSDFVQYEFSFHRHCDKKFMFRFLSNLKFRGTLVTNVDLVNDSWGFFAFGQNRNVRDYTVTAVTVIAAVRLLTAEICSYGRYNG